jgi:hypothetical protein
MERVPDTVTHRAPSFGRLKASEPPAKAGVVDSDMPIPATAKATILQKKEFFM